MMSRLKQILEGWTKLAYDKLVGLPPASRELANKRILICDTCPIRIGNRCDPLQSGVNVKTGKKEKGCGCILPAKVLSMDAECPLGKW